MDRPLADRAARATIALARQVNLPTDEANVVWSTNKLSLRLLPCDVFARVAVKGHEVSAMEVSVACALATVGAPVAALEPRVEPRVYEHDGFAVTFWTYYDQAASAPVSSTTYADALYELHAAMRKVDVATPHFMDRVTGAEALVSDRALTPALADADRALLAGTLASLRTEIQARGAVDQLLHGEPHPGNVLNTQSGARFIDFETCCRGPVEFDVAHGPVEVSARYPDLDPELVQACRHLVLAMVAAWRWEKGDQFPNGLAHGRNLVRLLRAGPPWPPVGSLAPSE